MSDHKSTDLDVRPAAERPTRYWLRLDPVDRAVQRLGRLWQWLSLYHAAELGFGYVLQPDAPNTYSELLEAWERSRATGTALPISSENSDTSIYGSVKVNGAFRFVHDVLHITTGLSFTTDDELRVADLQLQSLRGAGFDSTSLEHRILHADLVGQTFAVARNGCFPSDQREFVVACLTRGIEEAVRLARPASPTSDATQSRN